MRGMKSDGIVDLELMEKFSRLIEEKMGLFFSENRRGMFVDKLNLIAKDYGFSSISALYEWMHSANLKTEHIEKFATRLTIGETYFYRDKAMLADMAKYVLPPIIQNKKGSDKKLKIWSAGCSSGEEAYSIAMMLSETLPSFNDWEITILATDINQLALSKAASGEYKEWSFRGTPDRIRGKYFAPISKGIYKIDYRLKKNIDFQYLNLATDPFPSLTNNTIGFDLIFCRNVLIYFSPHLVRKIIHKFQDCLVTGGYLAVGGAEGGLINEPSLISVNLPQAILYKKGTATELKSSKINHRPKTVDLNSTPSLLKHNGNLVSPRKASTEKQGKINGKKKSKAAKLDKCSESSVDINAGYEKALKLYSMDKYTEALNCLKEKNINTGDELKVNKLLVRINANLGNYDEAVRYCREGLELDMFDPECYYLQGLLQQERGEKKEAEKSFFRSIYLNPEYELAYYAMANCCLHSGQTERALKYFANAEDLLRQYQPDDIIPGSDKLSANRLLQIISSIVNNIVCYEKVS